MEPFKASPEKWDRLEFMFRRVFDEVADRFRDAKVVFDAVSLAEISATMNDRYARDLASPETAYWREELRSLLRGVPIEVEEVRFAAAHVGDGGEKAVRVSLAADTVRALVSAWGWRR